MAKAKNKVKNKKLPRLAEGGIVAPGQLVDDADHVELLIPVSDDQVAKDLGLGIDNAYLTPEQRETLAKETAGRLQRGVDLVAAEFANDQLPAPQKIEPVILVGTPKPSITIKGKLNREQKTWLMDQLTDGVDYGKIHVVSKDKCPAEYKQSGSCGSSYHYSKAVLFKPGQEKIFGLFELTDKLSKDTETIDMLPNVPNLVAYKCTVMQNGLEIAEGRGAAEVGEQRRNANSTIKIGEKRARMDATLSLGLSDLFAQDLDDPDYKEAVKFANEKVAAEAERIDTDEFGLWPRDPQLPPDDSERKVLYRQINKAGYKERDDILALLEKNDLKPDQLKSGQVRDFMRKLRDGYYEAVPVRVKDEPAAETTQEPDSSLDQAMHNMDEATVAVAKEPMPDLTVDDELKQWVQTEIETLALNHHGTMWLKREVIGKPFGDLAEMTDKQWRRAYDVVTGILDLEIELKPHYRRDTPTTPVAIDFDQTNDNSDLYDQTVDATPEGMQQRYHSDPSMH